MSSSGTKQLSTLSRHGGIGRRARFKIEFLVSVGSIPTVGILNVLYYNDLC